MAIGELLNPAQSPGEVQETSKQGTRKWQEHGKRENVHADTRTIMACRVGVQRRRQAVNEDPERDQEQEEEEEEEEEGLLTNNE